MAVGLFVLPAGAVAQTAPTSVVDAPSLDTPSAFTRLRLDDTFTCEGASFADFDRDGHADVVAGPWWYAGPDFTLRRELYAPQTFDAHGYGDNFFAFPDDLDGDGWTDVLVVGFPGQDARWYENPGASVTADDIGHWARHEVFDGVDNESPAYVDLTGDGARELVFLHGGRYGWAEPDAEDPRAPWRFRALSPDLGLPTFSHGLGVGDIDGDGRLDLVEKTGWWRQPASLDGDPAWEHHAVPFAGRGGAQMLVDDVDGDGDADVITSLDAHGFGLVWYEQLPGDASAAEVAGASEGDSDSAAAHVNASAEVAGASEGAGDSAVAADNASADPAPTDAAPRFTRHLLMGDVTTASPFGLRVSELHALALVDVDGDGLRDIVTGKRHWAHGPDGSPDVGAPSLLVWFRCVRGADGVVWEPRVIDADSGVGTQVVAGDVDGDGRTDVVVGNKQGAFVFVQRDALAASVFGGGVAPVAVAAAMSQAAGAAAPSAVTTAAAQSAGTDVPATATTAATATTTTTTTQAATADTATSARRAPLGIRPVADDGRPLNLDFETGDLTDWTVAGQAFVGQPVTGDTVAARGREASRHAGDHWVGGYEIAGDGPTGTLTSAPFTVTHPWASFLVGGGGHASTRVEILRVDERAGDGAADDGTPTGGDTATGDTGDAPTDGNSATDGIDDHDSDRDTNPTATTSTVIHSTSGANYESMQRVVVELHEHVGARIALRLVDEHAGGWGHINYDDFLFHAEEPSFERPPNVPPILVPDPVVHAGLRPAEAAAAMTVPEGFAVDLIAGEPDLHQPVALTTDARGRLWVAEAHAYPVRVADEDAADRIVVFADEDGDGRFETRTVFLEGLNLVSGLAVGHGGVWIGAAPYLFFVPDEDHDLVPDGPAEVRLDGWAYEDTHETLNGFTWGPDGWLYGCHGVFTHSTVGAPGTPDEQRVPLNAGVWRYHPTRGDFEVFAWGSSNPWGLDFDALGEAFITACVIPHLYHLVPGGRYLRQAGQHFGAHVYDDIDTIADHLHWQGQNPWAGNNRSAALGGGHAHCGALIYQADAFPPEYRGLLLMNNIHGNRINADRLEPSGSGYVGRHADDLLLANDSWYRGIALETGPDGAVYLIDWYDQRACHWTAPEVWDRSNGRLYRLRYGDVAPWSGDLTALADDQLVALLKHTNQWFVRQARLELAHRADRGVVPRGPLIATLRRLLNEGQTAQQQLEALWTLHVIGALDDDLQLSLLASSDEPAVRAWTVRLGAEAGTPSEALAAAWYLLADDPSPVVRRSLASALQRLPVDDGTAARLAAAASVSAAPGSDASSAGPEPDAPSVASDPEPAGVLFRWVLVCRLASVSADVGDQNIPLLLWYGLEPLVTSRPLGALALARSTPHEQLGDFVVRRLAAESGHTEVLAATLAAEAPGPRRARWLDLWVDALEARDVRDAPPSWRGLATRLAADGSAAERDAALRLAARFGDTAARPVLAALLRDADAPLPRRRLALDALARLADPAVVDDLAAALAEPALREPALAALAAFDRADIPELVLAPYADYDAAQRRAALATLAARPGWALALLRAVDVGRVDLSHLSAALLRQLRVHDGAELVALRRRLGIRDEASPAGEAALAGWLARLTPDVLEAADPVAGRELFAATCQQCHTLFGEGGAVGPELTGANRGDLEYLLSNVLDPSAVVGRDYRATNIWLDDGRVVTGLLVSESDAAVTLRTETGDVAVPSASIETRRLSELSLMADGLLDGLGEDSVADLMAYLSSTRQVPRLATPERVAALFDGTTLEGWSGDPAVWSLHDGVIIGRSAAGLAHNSFLASDLELSDFRLTCEVRLMDDAGNSGIQFRSRVGPDGDVSGYQADIGPGWWGKLYEEHGRGLLWERGGEQHVRSGRWNTYVIEARGHHVRTWLNGEPCVDLLDPEGALRGVLAFQVHSGGPTEIRLRGLSVELLD